MIIFGIVLVLVLFCFAVSVWVLSTHVDEKDVLEGFILRKPGMQESVVDIPKREIPITINGKAIVSDIPTELIKKFPKSSIPIVSDGSGYAKVLYLGSFIPEESPEKLFNNQTYIRDGILVWECDEPFKVDDLPPDLKTYQRSRISTFRSKINDSIMLINYYRHPTSVANFWDAIRSDIVVHPEMKMISGVDMNVHI